MKESNKKGGENIEDRKMKKSSTLIMRETTQCKGEKFALIIETNKKGRKIRSRHHNLWVAKK